ncbi:MAG TPA: choice-of-anchor tandem repeat GloVer-containing protein [Candidatus Binataceae bacterium]|nr:choice-of-anchor tandem repeat GloVer-containing protein [Candidatus Binataceae bacterium]
MRLSKSRFVCAILALLMLASVNVIARGQASGASERILWSFRNGADGILPSAGLIMDASGNLYSTTLGGGTQAAGTVFEVTPPAVLGGDWTESILWSFGNVPDGAGPFAAVLMDGSGNLYGTTFGGGAYDAGTVFKLTPPSTVGGNWTESILWNFGRGADGYNPYAGLIMDGSGNLYGTTYEGGVYGPGTVFKLTPPSANRGNWTESILWNFGNGADGKNPYAGLILEASGNLYGTTDNGGAYGLGTAFMLTPHSTGGKGNWSASILWSFGNGADGQHPLGGPIMDASGNLYGTTNVGGPYDNGINDFGGTAFELSPPSSSGGNWTESILWSFGREADGQIPYDGLIMDPSGNLYGTTYEGGAFGGMARRSGDGTTFKLTRKGGNWTESILWNFGNGASDGILPFAGLIMDGSGNLYGTTSEGGDYAGTVFEISNISGPQIIVSPRNVVFPDTEVGSTSIAKVRVRNTGTEQLIGAMKSPPRGFSLSGPGNFNLAPNTEATITMMFTPTSTRRTLHADAIVSNAVNHSTVHIKLEGTGTP